MNVRVFGISDKTTLELLPIKTLSPSWQQDAVHRWIDVEAATQNELRELLAPLELQTTMLDACLHPERVERFISHRAALYLEVPTHLGWDESEKPYITILCLNTTLITIHRDRQHTIEDIIRGMDGEIPLHDNSSPALLEYLLREVSRHNIDMALAVRADAERLDLACREQPESLDPRQIALLRRKINHCAAVHDDHTYCAGVLQSVESEAFRMSEQSGFFEHMLTLAELARQLIDGAESRVRSLERDYELSVQKRVDNRLRFLTILSAVFLPLTLISAIYGMNFDDLPGMGIPYGYVIVIGLMLATAGITGGYLYWQRWFE